MRLKSSAKRQKAKLEECSFWRRSGRARPQVITYGQTVEHEQMRRDLREINFSNIDTECRFLVFFLIVRKTISFCLTALSLFAMIQYLK